MTSDHRAFFGNRRSSCLVASWLTSTSCSNGYAFLCRFLFLTREGSARPTRLPAPLKTPFLFLLWRLRCRLLAIIIMPIPIVCFIFPVPVAIPNTSWLACDWSGLCCACWRFFLSVLSYSDDWPSCSWSYSRTYYRQETSSYHFSPRSKFRCSYGFAFLCQFRVPFVLIACVPVAGSYLLCSMPVAYSSYETN